MKEIILLILYIFVIGIILSTIQPICYYIYHHKEWKTWKYFIKNADKFQIDHIINKNEVYIWEQYKAIIWEDGLCSIHIKDGECIVSTFIEKLSKQMAKKLKNK